MAYLWLKLALTWGAGGANLQTGFLGCTLQFYDGGPFLRTLLLYSSKPAPLVESFYELRLLTYANILNVISRAK